jgi:tetratricopeptide (TPR) repeat protein
MGVSTPTPNPFSRLPTLVSRTLTLRPLLAGDFESLYAAASDPLIWSQHPEPTRYQREVFQRFFDSALAGGSTYIAIDNASRQVIGSSRYYEWNPQSREIAIGYTFLARSHWGRGTNSEMKRLMLGQAFAHANTVWFHVGKGNLRSRKAIEKLGARFSHEQRKEMFGQAHEYVFYRIDSPAFREARQKQWMQAVKSHQQGDMPRAKAAYEQTLAVEPRHFDALHLLGVIEFQSKNHAAAVALIDRAIAINPHHASAYSNRGLALKELGQWQEAVESYDKAISLNPGFSQAYCNRGVALKELKRWDEAIENFDRAIALKPDYAEAHANLGAIFNETGRWDQALASYDKAIRFNADYARAWFGRGLALHALQKMEEALASFDRALSLDLVSEQALCNRGITLNELKRWQEGYESCSRAIALNPEYAPAYCNRGIALLGLKRLSKALADFNKAILLKPDFVEAWYNRGVTLKDMQRWDEAIASYHEALRLKGDHLQACTNLGSAYKETRQLARSLACYDKAIKTQAGYTPALWNKALTHLLMGEFKPGWELYEWRWKSGDGIFYKYKRQFAQPMWLGHESLAGKTILLHAEQGFGDTIQFCRYANAVADKGARVVLEVPRPLMGLMEGLEGVSELVMREAELPAFDMHCPLMTLPLAFNTDLQSIPSPGPYLFSVASKRKSWRERLGPKRRKRVGLVWSGSPEHTNDTNRSMSLAQFIEHLPSGCEYVCLQKDIRESDMATLAHSGIRHFENEITDFSDTAALCDLMDVVVCVDTSVAHLAGALGKTTWLLLPFIPDWRWLLDRDDSPWYASMRLYRQRVDRSWEPVLKRVASDLTALIGSRSKLLPHQTPRARAKQS